MKTADFEYALPPELIAQVPVEPRDASRLLVVDRHSGCLEHRQFSDLRAYLRKNDVLVANDSRVLPARLFGRKGTGGRVELLLVRERGDGVWDALVKPGRRVREGDWLEFDEPTSVGKGVEAITTSRPVDGRLRAEVLERTDFGGRRIRFGGCGNLTAVVERYGIVPLPPYIHTPLANPGRYQTVYARAAGSAAAPTAGLHFTNRLMGELQAAGVGFVFVTLHIGLDTFRPVSTDEIEDHEMHSECASLSPEAVARLNLAREQGGRIIAVGTTAVRVLETAAHDDGTIHPHVGRTRLFIRPGYRFKAVDGLVTNFHLPRSTLLMLVSAFSGKDLLFRAYDVAVLQRYRFYSFGDAMLIV